MGGGGGVKMTYPPQKKTNLKKASLIKIKRYVSYFSAYPVFNIFLRVAHVVKVGFYGLISL